MAAGFEVGVEEGFYHFDGLVVGDEAAGHGEEVGVVVAACQRCYLGYPA